MGSQKKPKRSWIYLSEEDQQRLDNLVRAVGTTVNEVAILSTLTSAALKACAEAGSRMPLPLKFEIIEGVPAAAPKPITKGHR